MDSSIMTMLQNASKKYGIPTSILYSIVMTESSGNPYQRTLSNTEDSRGLFQVNVMANPSVNSSQLFDPSYNINYQVPKLVSTYNDGLSKGLTGSSLAQYVEKYGQKPQWNSTVSDNINKYYNQYVAATTGFSQTSSNDYPAAHSNQGDSSSGANTDYPAAHSGSTSGSDSSSSTDGSLVPDYTSVFDTAIADLKFGFVYLILFIILLFAGYMVFVNKGGKE